MIRKSNLVILSIIYFSHAMQSSEAQSSIENHVQKNMFAQCRMAVTGEEFQIPMSVQEFYEVSLEQFKSMVLKHRKLSKYARIKLLDQQEIITTDDHLFDCLQNTRDISIVIIESNLVVRVELGFRDQVVEVRVPEDDEDALVSVKRAVGNKFYELDSNKLCLLRQQGSEFFFSIEDEPHMSWHQTVKIAYRTGYDVVPERFIRTPDELIQAIREGRTLFGCLRMKD